MCPKLVKYPHASSIVDKIEESTSFLESTLNSVVDKRYNKDNFILFINVIKSTLTDESVLNYLENLPIPIIDDMVEDFSEYTTIFKSDWGRYKNDLSFYLYSSKILLETILSRISPPI